MQTRIGPLSFDVGYPTVETAERLYDELDFQHATQAYVWDLVACEERLSSTRLGLGVHGAGV